MERKIIDLVPATGNAYNLEYGGVTIWTQMEFKLFIATKKRSYLYDCISDDPTQCEQEFATLFSEWASIMGASVSRALGAFNSTYNPLENYDRMEEGSEQRTIGESGTETTARHKGTKTSTGEEIVTTPRAKTKATNYKVAFDSNTEVETESTVSEGTDGTDKVERDATKNFVTQTDIDANTYDKDVREFSNRTTSDKLDYVNRRTHGNIGVTTSQQMIESELKLRRRNLIFDYMAAFVDEFCRMCEGVE